MNLTVIQEMHLKNVRVANKAWRDAKAGALQRAKQAAAEEIRDYRASMDHEVRLAYEAGVPKASLHTIGLATRDSNTLALSLHRTEGSARALAEAFERDPLADRYSWDEGTRLLRVTLTGDVLANAIRDVDWAIEGSHAIELGVHVAEFSVASHGGGIGYLISVTNRWLPEFQEEHPVPSWASLAKNELEATTWFKDNIGDFPVTVAKA